MPRGSSRVEEGEVMKRRRANPGFGGVSAATALLTLALIAAPAPAAPAEPGRDSAPRLKVLSFNAWHGLRSGESKKRFPGEEPERKLRRFDWQIEEMRRLDPDVLLLQEVNPNQREARRYAEALGFDEIHKVTSCGIHLGGCIKIPSNVNEGLAILARPELGLRRVGTKRLSGDASCSATWGFQTKESRYVLFGEITLGGRKILLATTHFSAPPFVPPGFEDALERLVAGGNLQEEQRGEILEILEAKRARNLREAEKLLDRIDRRRRRLVGSGPLPPVVLGGDFNNTPETDSIALIGSEMKNVAVGPDFLSWDPVTNHVNYGIGSRRAESLPTFDLAEVRELLALRGTTPRQIDFVFVSEGLAPVSTEMVMDRERDGIYPSDHFGILTVLRLLP
jgi:endonuclease/exonuclease/phosphatase family metal-dependent hydrolase